MNEEIRLVMVTEAPVNAIIELYRDAGWWEEGWSVEAIAPMVAHSFRFAALYRGDELVGMGRAISDGVSDGYIQDVVVRSDLRGQGWGQKIITALVKELQKAGVDWIGLISAPGTSEFYKKLGFAEMHEFTPMKFHC